MLEGLRLDHASLITSFCYIELIQYHLNSEKYLNVFNYF